MSKCKCDTCIYRASNMDLWKCNYILINNHSRPCEPGKECIVYKKGNRLKIKM